MKKKIIYGVAVALVLLAAYLLFFRNGDGDRATVTVVRGSITEEIFETGSVKKGESVTLSFKESGRVISILVSENQTVERGDVIARIENNSLQIQLADAREAKRSAEIALERLLLGSRDEEVRMVQSALSSAEDSLSSAKRALTDTERSAEEALSSAYKDISSIISSASLELQVTSEDAKDFIDNYFGGFVTIDGATARSGRDKIYEAFNNAEKYRNVVREDLSYAEKDKALAEMQKSLQLALSGIEQIISVAQIDTYNVPSTAIDAMRVRETRTISSLNAVTSLIQGVSSTRASTEAQLNSARAAVVSAENRVESAKIDLERITASPLKTEIEERESAVRRAEGNISLIEERIRDTYLTAPFSGRVSEINGRVGQVASPGFAFANLVSDDRFYIESFVYEGDIVKMRVGNPVEVEFVAFPGEIIEGEVSFINETGRLINNVVYYNIHINVDDIPDGVMAEMSCDITIKTMEKDNILTIPDRYLERREGKRIAKVKSNGSIEEREIETGIRGTGGVIEIISGLNEGDIVYE